MVDNREAFYSTNVAMEADPIMHLKFKKMFLVMLALDFLDCSVCVCVCVYFGKFSCVTVAWLPENYF